jgi:2-polyprenyl-3-methyl-5-hydroxy-6-metoxy-1,4-benzoquinol methylase
MVSSKSSTNYRQRIYADYGKNFQDAPETFDHAASLRRGKAYRYYLRNWLPGIKSVRIVDLACGHGALLHFFKEQGYINIEGVDISRDQVALSRQITPNVTEANVIEYLEAHVNQFDLITGFDIIEHFYKDELMCFIDAANAALKPGGRLILQTPNAGVPWGTQLRYGDFTHEIGLNPNVLARLLSISGFGTIEARECNPPAYGYSLFSSIRFGFWQLVRLHMLAWNLIETGSTGSRVLTRVFLMSACKPL